MKLRWIGDTYYGEPMDQVIRRWSPATPRYSPSGLSMAFDNGELFGVNGRYYYISSNEMRGKVTECDFSYFCQSRDEADRVYDLLKKKLMDMYGRADNVDGGLTHRYFMHNTIILSDLQWLGYDDVLVLQLEGDIANGNKIYIVRIIVCKQAH